MGNCQKRLAATIPTENVVVDSGFATARLNNGDGGQQPPVQSILVGGAQKIVNVTTCRTSILHKKRSQDSGPRVVQGFGCEGSGIALRETVLLGSCRQRQQTGKYNRF